MSIFNSFREDMVKLPAIIGAICQDKSPKAVRGKKDLIIKAEMLINKNLEKTIDPTTKGILKNTLNNLILLKSATGDQEIQKYTLNLESQIQKIKSITSSLLYSSPSSSPTRDLELSEGDEKIRGLESPSSEELSEDEEVSFEQAVEDVINALDDSVKPLTEPFIRVLAKVKEGDYGENLKEALEQLDPSIMEHSRILSLLLIDSLSSGSNPPVFAPLAKNPDFLALKNKKREDLKALVLEEGQEKQMAEELAMVSRLISKTRDNFHAELKTAIMIAFTAASELPNVTDIKEKVPQNFQGIKTLINKHQYNEAEKLIGSLSNLAERKVAFEMLFKAHFSMGNWGEAERLARLSNDYELLKTVISTKVNALIDSGNYERAEALVVDCEDSTISDDFVQLLKDKCSKAIQSKEIDAAPTIYRALKFPHFQAIMFEGLVDLFIENQELDEAIKFVEQNLPDGMETHFPYPSYAKIALAAGDFEEPEGRAVAMIKKIPEDLHQEVFSAVEKMKEERLENRVLSLIEEGHYQEAAKSLSQIEDLEEFLEQMLKTTDREIVENLAEETTGETAALLKHLLKYTSGNQ